MATTRLRKTFQYQEEPSDDDGPEAMDEQEQEELIEKLKKENDEKNDVFLQVFLAIPCISWVLFLAGFIRARSPAARLVCLLGITSLWATAYNLLLIPTSTGLPRRPTKVGGFEISVPEALSPAQKYVPLLNAALSALVALWGLSFRDGRGVIGGFWMTCWLPLIEYLMIQMARKWIVEVDPGELEKLKYDFRGA